MWKLFKSLKTIFSRNIHHHSYVLEILVCVFTQFRKKKYQIKSLSFAYALSFFFVLYFGLFPVKAEGSCNLLRFYARALKKGLSLSKLFRRVSTSNIFEPR